MSLVISDLATNIFTFSHFPGPNPECSYTSLSLLLEPRQLSTCTHITLYKFAQTRRRKRQETPRTRITTNQVDSRGTKNAGKDTGRRKEQQPKKRRRLLGRPARKGLWLRTHRRIVRGRRVATTSFSRSCPKPRRPSAFFAASSSLSTVLVVVLWSHRIVKQQQVSLVVFII